MPFYPKLKRSNIDRDVKSRTAKNILKLKDQLAESIPRKDLNDHCLLATWNIRDLGRNGAKHGKRTLEDLFYIAEILSAFDLIAVQEVNDLYDWEIVMEILGQDWDYISTDVSEWKDGGNGERMTFVYDKRKIWFKNIAGEIVLSSTNLISNNVEMADDIAVPQGRQFARTPFLVSFQSGWFNFDLCTVHIYFGAESGKKLKRRIKEIEGIAEEIGERATKSLKSKDAMILLGDFNIVHPEHETMKALKKNKFKIPNKLNRPTNLNNDKYYDQIAIRTSDKALMKYLNKEDGMPNAGVFEMFDKVMKVSQWKTYKPEMQKTTKGKKLRTDAEFKNYFIKEWRTYHLSDHKPLWVRIPIDQSKSYLKDIG